MSHLFETLVKSSHRVREVPCAYLELGDETKGLLPEDGVTQDDVALLLPASSAPISDFLKAGKMSVEVKAGSFYWHDAKGQVCRAGSDQTPLAPSVLEAASRPEGLLVSFVNDVNGMAPGNWIVLVSEQAQAAS